MRYSFLFLKIEEIFQEIQSVRSYDVIPRVMFENSKNITFPGWELNLGGYIDFCLDYDVISLLYSNVGLTSDTDVKPTLDCKAYKFWTIGVN